MTRIEHRLFRLFAGASWRQPVYGGVRRHTPADIRKQSRPAALGNTMNSKGKYYLTTAIAYTSGKPHIGNVYEIVLADSIARFKRLEGYDVYFQTGTDEHGQKNELKAEAEGVTPKSLWTKLPASSRDSLT